jgi:hypothetical protein
MGGDKLSPSGVLCLFGDRAVADDREANGRFLPPTSKRKARMMAGLMDAAREQSGGTDLARTEARFEKVTSRTDDADFQLPTLLMSVAAWSLREQRLVELEPLDTEQPRCRMTLAGWTPRPSVEGMLLDTLKAGGPRGFRRRWKLGKALGSTSSLRSTIALLDIGRLQEPQNAWQWFQAVWQHEAASADRDQLGIAYDETMDRWSRFNAAQRELADAIREDAFLGITHHIPPTHPSTYQ